MKHKTLFSASLFLAITIGISNLFFPSYAATTHPDITIKHSFLQASARYRYIISADISVQLDSSNATYDLNIFGIDDVTTISGTTTLYKKAGTSSYSKIDSERISFNNNTASYTGYLDSKGEGEYKLEFVGKVYTANSSESITIRCFESY